MASAPRLGTVSSVLVILAMLASVLLLANLRRVAEAPAAVFVDAAAAGEAPAQPVLLPSRLPTLQLRPLPASNQTTPSRVRSTAPRGYDPSSWRCDNVLETLSIEGILDADARHDGTPFANRGRYLESKRQLVTPLPIAAPSASVAQRSAAAGGCVLFAFFHFDKVRRRARNARARILGRLTQLSPRCSHRL
jgi:hypothetical protein